MKIRIVRMKRQGLLAVLKTTRRVASEKNQV
jgi:hypothetical protein